MGVVEAAAVGTIEGAAAGSMMTVRVDVQPSQSREDDRRTPQALFHRRSRSA